MKNIPLQFLICLATVTPMLGQSYRPLLQSGREWVTATWLAYEQCFQTGLPPWSDCTVRVRYVLDGDTVIQGTTYHQCWEQPFSLASGWQGPFTLGSLTYAGALREDTVARKVFAYAPALQAEVLLHDFGLQAGESADVCLDPFWSATSFLTVSIDSITFLPDGRTKWWMPIYQQLVEGVGMNHGLFPSYHCFEACVYLGCLKQDGAAVFDETNWPFQELYLPACSYTITSAHTPVREDGRVWPNPTTTGWVTVTDLEYGDDEPACFDVWGKRYLAPVSGNRVDLSGLPAGVYVLVYKGGRTTVVKL